MSLIFPRFGVSNWSYNPIFIEQLNGSCRRECFRGIDERFECLLISDADARDSQFKHVS